MMALSICGFAGGLLAGCVLAPRGCAPGLRFADPGLCFCAPVFWRPFRAQVVVMIGSCGIGLGELCVFAFGALVVVMIG